MSSFSYEVPEYLMDVYTERYNFLVWSGFNHKTANMYACVFCQSFCSPINEVAEAICETWGTDLLRSSGRKVLVRKAREHNTECNITALAADLV
jgi:hypothetical protein